MSLLDELLPGQCLACRVRTSFSATMRFAGGALLCGRCESAIMSFNMTSRCPVCGIPLPRFVGVCERCRRETYSFDRVIALQPNTGIPAALVRALKFGRRRSAARAIAGAMIASVEQVLRDGFVLVPVPSRRRSVRVRGFAGAELIAGAIADLTHQPLRRLLRNVATRAQKDLGYDDRQRNARRSIRVVRGAEVPERVLLVDDVLTTGATADACAWALKARGASHVVVAVFAMEY